MRAVNLPYKSEVVGEFIIKVSKRGNDMISKMQRRAQGKKGLKFLDSVFDLAVNDADIGQTAIELANEYLKNNNYDVKKASIEMIESQEVFKETDTLRYIGKRFILDSTIPADVAGNLYVQIRMITALAVMGGYDPQDYLIKTLVFITLMGMSSIDISKRMGIYIGSRITVQAVKNSSEKCLRKINEAAGYRLVMVLCHDGINVVSKAPVYESGLIEPFDSNFIKMVAKRAVDLFLQ